MLKIRDLLNRTVRKDIETNRRVVVESIIIVLCIAICFYLCIFYIADIDGYLQHNKQTIHLYDFYDQKVGDKESAVFFIGSSIVGSSIYTPEINRIVKNSYNNITAYNLFVAADLPIERTLEIQKIIDANPSLVIYGITYRSVTDIIDPARFFDRIKPVYSRLDIRDDSLYLFNVDEKTYFAPLSDLEKRRYLHSAIDYIFSDHETDPAMNYSFDPYGEKHRLSCTKKPLSEIVAQANNPNNKWRPVVTNESTRYKDAFLYNVKTLQDAGIPVIILNMPLHPLLSEKITDESRANFYDLLNETGAVWYDLERDYSDDFFEDSHHALYSGALKFAPRMADLIIEQVEKDVIHYA